METLTSHSAGSAALHQLTLGAFGSVDTWLSDPAQAVLRRLAEEADDHEIGDVPGSVGSVLPLLVNSPDNLRVALDAILRFDLYEAAWTGLDTLVWRGHPEAVLTAAGLAAHPGVSNEFRDLVRAHGSDLGEEWQRDLYFTRLDPSHQPQTDVARADRKYRWIAAQPYDLPAIVIVPATSDALARSLLRIAIDAASSGIVVRRLPTVKQSDAPPGWIRSWMPELGPSAPRDLRVSEHWTDAGRRRILRELERIFHTRSVLEVALPSLPRWTLPQISSIEVFDDGALPRREVSFLGGIGQSQFNSLRKYATLHPRLERGIAYWSFSQVVGVRVARYLFHISGRTRGFASVADNLVRLSRERKQVPVGVTEKGEILARDRNSVYNLENGQIVDEDFISLIDKVYQPFTLGEQAVAGLLKPSRFTTVHPSVSGGLPCVRNTRVTVGAVEKTIAGARRVGNPNPTRFAANIFGIQLREAEDAESVANAVNAAH